ncbi:hypothetical protein GCM10023199_13810 [Actinomycetospora chibensis]
MLSNNINSLPGPTTLGRAVRAGYGSMRKTDNAMNSNVRNIDSAPSRRLRPADLPTLSSVADLTALGVRNAADRVRRWVAAGDLHEAGTYFPPSGKPLTLYQTETALALAEGRPALVA